MANQITEVRLLSVPLENDYKHTLYFESPEAQASYFIGKTVFSELDFSYQRKEGYIRYPKHFDDLQNCNYIMYKNNAYSTKWYYAFITEMAYKGDETTWIYFETDVIQTYLFDYIVKPSFVEREHVNDDTVGLHTIPENLEAGEFVATYSQKVSELSDLRIVMGVTEFNDDGKYYGTRYNGLYSGISYLGFDNDETHQINSALKEYAEAGAAEAINSLFIAPKFLVSIKEDSSGNPTGERLVNGSEEPAKLTQNISKTNRNYSFTVNNNKLKCFPYKYILVSNNNGASAVYHYEEFSENTMQFEIRGVLTPGCSIRIIPKKYKGVDYNEEEGLNLGKYPICNWASDVYTNWLTQNGTNIALNYITGGAQIIGGAIATFATGGLASAVGGASIAGGVSRIANQVAQTHQMSFTPPQAQGNTNCGDVVCQSGNNTFTFYMMSIKEEYAMMIDNYFNMFGYKCNRVKVPLSNHRANYWYTKTIDVNIDGAIPMKDMQKIKDCYNTGLTFWKNPENIGNYNVSNNIRS